MVIKLENGKEVQVKDIERREALKFKIASASGYAGFDVFYDCALYATGLTRKDFEDQYTDEEIIEIAGKVFERMNLSDTQKKS